MTVNCRLSTAENGESAIDNRQSAIHRRPLTETQRAACRRNGLKGALVWLHMLKQGYMLPAEKVQKVYDALVKCAFWHLTESSARYASHFREGISAISLVRSLAAAGETISEYARHVQSVVRAFTNCRFSIADCQLVSSEFGVRSSELPDSSELLSSKFEVPESEDRIATSVIRNARCPAACPEPEGGDTARNSELRTSNSEPSNLEPNNFELSNSGLLVTLSTALAEVSWRRFRASHAHAEWERRSVMRLFRRFAEERERGETITAQRLVWLAEDLHKVLFLASQRFEVKLRRLNRRFEALAARVLKERGLPPMNLHVRPSPAVNAATAGSVAAALGNPFVDPGRVRDTAARPEPRVKQPKDWDHCRGVSRPGRRRRRTPEEQEDRVAFLRQSGLFGSGPRWERAVEGLEHCRLSNCRFSIDDCRLSSSELGVPERDSTLGRPAEPCALGTPNSELNNLEPDNQQAIGNRQSAIGNGESAIENRQLFFALVARALGPNPALRPGEEDATPEGLAEALWNRLEFARDQAGQDRDVFRALLDDYLGSLDKCRWTIDDCRWVSSELSGSKLFSSKFEVPGPEGPIAHRPEPDAGITEKNSEVRRMNAGTGNSELNNFELNNSELSARSPDLTDLATDLVVLLRADDDEFRIEASLLNFRAKAWIYLMLVVRGIPRKPIRMLQPGTPADCGFLDRYLKLGKRRRAQAHDLLDKIARVDEEWERWKPVIESGDIRKLATVERDVDALIGQLLRMQTERKG